MTLSAAQITAQQKFIIISPVAGTTFNQLKDGSVRVYINPQNAARFKQEIMRFCGEIDRYLLAQAEAARAVEASKSVLPKTRMQELEEEIARLRNEAESNPKTREIPPAFRALPPNAMGTENDQTLASALVASGVPLHQRTPASDVTNPAECPPAIPNFDDDAARAKTIVSGGFEP